MTRSTHTVSWFRLDRHEDPDPSGAGDPPGDPTDPPADPPSDPPAGDDDLAKMRDALAKERAARRDAEKARKAAEDRAAELDRLQLSEQERAIAEAAEKAKADAEAAAGQRITALQSQLISAEVRAAAKGQVHDTALGDLAVFVGADEALLNDDGTVNTEAVTAKVAEVIDARPYLKSTAAPPPGGDGGRHGSGDPIDYRTASPEQVAARYAELGIRPHR